MLKAGRLTAPLTDVPLQAANGRQDWSVILCPGAPWPRCPRVDVPILGPCAPMRKFHPSGGVVLVACDGT